MCRERIIDDEKVDNTSHEEYNQLIEQIQDNKLNELLLTTANLQKESERLENEARKLIYENIQMQIEARLLKDKYYYRRRYAFLIRKKSFNFQQLKKQIRIERNKFFKFERRLREKYEQPLYSIISNTTTTTTKKTITMSTYTIDIN
ncbi:unnamed protein product [Rotaria sp. Silwood2]|nr:unnamed protein product [Rotaria sp. Silwood2]CAF3464945.1 unnamed protein product [Rotaria sp. Silwood2]CAF4556035.1 unnamed protein product [Rotaria sp. Silwood2]CAF4646353.1 unnamed protein product [Rotaria sp. Silwood2]CAF4815495.1 unnamed protein product [Rotaria sp. Silwood2]